MASKIKIPYTVEPWFYDDELPQAQKKLEAAGLADLNLLRVRRNIKNPILLFMPKEDIVSVGNTARRIKE
jgi:hypothetical protein